MCPRAARVQVLYERNWKYKVFAKPDASVSSYVYHVYV